MHHHVRTNGELEALHRAGGGLIYNDFTSAPTAADNNRLHLASCTWVERMLKHADPVGAPSVRKVFFGTFNEASVWLARHRGPVGIGWKQCARCSPGCPAVAVMACNESRKQSQSAQRQASSSQAGRVFRETEVERLLYAYLRNAGYLVTERVPVSSGIADAVAAREGERVLIEVKGEDAGGYGSAQMNLQIAIGQIATRMNDPYVTYAIALPLSPNYIRALRTFRGSPVFERLGLSCYLVSPDGQVCTIGAHEVREWISSLASRTVTSPPLGDPSIPRRARLHVSKVRVYNAGHVRARSPSAHRCRRSYEICASACRRCADSRRSASGRWLERTV